MPVAIVTRANAKQKKDEIRLANLSKLFAQKRTALLVCLLNYYLCPMCNIIIIFSIKLYISHKRIDFKLLSLCVLFFLKASRLEKMDISDANKYAILGDELRLRREIEFGYRIDERDTTSGRTILADAVAAGILVIHKNC